MRSSTLGRVSGILFVAIVIGGLVGWWLSRNPTEPGSTSPEPAILPPVSTETEPTTPPMTNIVTEIPTPTSPVAGTNWSADDWEDHMDEILTSETDTRRKAEDLLDMLPKVNEEAKIELAGHIVNLVEDDQYARVAPYLTNAAVPEVVSSVFMNDLYNRANSLKLPLVLAVARTENHPLREEAKDLLELYIEEDYGTDWAKWETAMNAWLKENPDEEK